MPCLIGAGPEMPVQKRKSRIVTFRISGEEYDALEQACAACGARSVSEFARAALFERVQAVSAPHLNLSGDLRTLGRVLDDVDAALREASRRIQRLLGPPASKDSTKLEDE